MATLFFAIGTLVVGALLSAAMLEIGANAVRGIFGSLGE